MVLPGIADVRTLELVSALGGDVQVEVQSVTQPAPEHPVLTISGFLSGNRRPIARPTISTSHTWRRRIPVDEVSRGHAGLGLMLKASEMSWVGITPWWQIPYVRRWALGSDS